MVEFALIMPWFVFLFIGTVDMGIYCYALISVQSAARVACAYTALNNDPTNQTKACYYALAQVLDLPNISSGSSCSAAPFVVSATQVTGANSPDGQPAAQVVVTYTPPSLPTVYSWIGTQTTITRTVVMKL